jgi:hypothetical protein
MDSIEYQNQDQPDDNSQVVEPGMICKHCKTVIPSGPCLIAPCNQNPNHPFQHEWVNPA